MSARAVIAQGIAELAFRMRAPERLAFRAGQSVAPFDAAHVVPFKCRVNALADVGQRAGQFGPPAQLGPGRHGTE